MRRSRPKSYYVAAKRKGGCTRQPPCEVWRWLEGEDGPELGAPIGGTAGGLAGNFGRTYAAAVGKRHTAIVALFVAKLHPGIHLVEDGCSLDRALDRTCTVGPDVLRNTEVVGVGPVQSVLKVSLPAGISAFWLSIEPA